MHNSLIRAIAVGITVVTLAACSSADVKPPPGPSSTDVNPITGSRGGSSSGSSR